MIGVEWVDEKEFEGGREVEVGVSICGVVVGEGTGDWIGDVGFFFVSYDIWVKNYDREDDEDEIGENR